MSDFGIDEDFNKAWEAANKVKPTTATIERLLHEKKELEAENTKLKQQVADHQHQEQLMEMVIERRDEYIKTLREALEEIETCTGNGYVCKQIAKAALEQV